MDGYSAEIAVTDGLNAASFFLHRQLAISDPHSLSYLLRFKPFVGIKIYDLRNK